MDHPMKSSDNDAITNSFSTNDVDSQVPGCGAGALDCSGDHDRSSADHSGENQKSDCCAPENENAEEVSEEKAFARIINVFLCYYVFACKQIDQQVLQYGNLPKRQQDLLPEFLDLLDHRKKGVQANCIVIRRILEGCKGLFQNRTSTCPSQLDWLDPAQLSPPVTLFDMERLESLLKHFARDWSDEGRSERAQSYGVVLDEVDSLYPVESSTPRSQIHVVVCGAGLGRLSWELTKRGFECQGNEFSYMMLLASNFVLNRCDKTNACQLFPYVLSTSNTANSEDMLQCIRFPDVDPSDLPSSRGRFSMAAGDFLQVYNDEPNSWDCVLTVFFIDTAHNIIDYLEVIYKMLKPGGYWINFGPLLYHFADTPGEFSLELSYEDVKNVMEKIGFIIVKEKLDCPAQYAQNYRLLLQHMYKCIFLVCQKPVE